MSDEHPWDDPEKKIEAHAYCRWVFDGLFPKLADALNETHSVDYSNRYWKIVAGPWFFHYIMAKHEKYVDKGCEFNSLDPIWMNQKHMGLSGRARNAYAAVLDLIGRTKPVILCDLHMSHIDMWRVAWASGFRAWPMIRRSERLDGTKRESDARDRFRRVRMDWGRDEFENVVLDGLMDVVPVIFLEYYKAMRDRALSFARGKQRAIVSSAGWKSNEPMKFIGAEVAEMGGLLVGAQHGGNTGWTSIHAMEDFTRDFAGEFITWGVWSGRDRIASLPDPAIQRIFYAKRRPPKKDALALFVGTAFPRYRSAGIRTQPMSRQMLRYMDWQNDFFREIGDLRDRFMVRTYPAEYGWQNKIRLLQEFPGIRLDYFERGLMYHLRKSALAVIDNPQTTFLEALAMNVPTILYFDPSLWVMGPEAKERFGAMEIAGIVHYSPESAALKAKEIFPDPEGWWNSPSVRKAREEFLGWCLLLDKRWPLAWAKAIEGWVQ